MQEISLRGSFFWRPLIKSFPLIHSRKIDGSLCRIEVAFSFEVVIKEGEFKILLVEKACLFTEADVSKIISLRAYPTSVKPRSYNQNVVVLFVACFNLLVSFEGTVCIFRVEGSSHNHDCRLHIVQIIGNGSAAPEGV